LFLCVNTGNTNIQCALGTARDYRQASIDTKGIRGAEYFTGFLEERFGTDIWRLLRGSVISSVVPSKTKLLKSAIREKTGKMPESVNRASCGVDFSGYTSNIGEDRVVCCAAAVRKYAPPLIIVDLGTATTFNIIDNERVFFGGAILAGVQTSLTALVKSAALLPKVGNLSDARVICSNTEQSLVSGAVLGTVCLIEGFIKRIQDELKIEPALIITGGNAPAVIPYCKFNFVYEPSLLLDGLFALYGGLTNEAE